jgi:hypothetical protein
VRLVTRFGHVFLGEAAADEGFSACIMREEYEAAGVIEQTGEAGDIEWFRPTKRGRVD